MSLFQLKGFPFATDSNRETVLSRGTLTLHQWLRCNQGSLAHTIGHLRWQLTRQQDTYFMWLFLYITVLLFHSDTFQCVAAVLAGKVICDPRTPSLGGGGGGEEKSFPEHNVAIYRQSPFCFCQYSRMRLLTIFDSSRLWEAPVSSS